MDARKKKNKKKKNKSARKYAEFVDEERVAHKPEGICLVVQGKASRGSSAGGTTQPDDMWVTQPERLPMAFEEPSSKVPLAASLPNVAAPRPVPEPELEPELESDEAAAAVTGFQTFSTFGKGILHGNQSSSLPSLPSAFATPPRIPRRPLSGEITGSGEFRFIGQPGFHDIDIADAALAAQPGISKDRPPEQHFDPYEEFIRDIGRSGAAQSQPTDPLSIFTTSTPVSCASSGIDESSAAQGDPTNDDITKGQKREQMRSSSPGRQRKIPRPSAPPPPVPMATRAGAAAPAPMEMHSSIPMPTRKAPPPPTSPTEKPSSQSKIPKRSKADSAHSPERAPQKKIPPPIPPKPSIHSRSKLPKPPPVPNAANLGTASVSESSSPNQPSLIRDTEQQQGVAGRPSAPKGRPHISLPIMKPAIPPKPVGYVLKSKVPKHLRKFNFAQAKTNTMMIPEEDQDQDGRQMKKSPRDSDADQDGGSSSMGQPGRSLQALQMDTARTEYRCDSTEDCPERLMIEIGESGDQQKQSCEGDTLSTKPENNKSDPHKQPSQTELELFSSGEPQRKYDTQNLRTNVDTTDDEYNDPLIAQIIKQTREESQQEYLLEDDLTSQSISEYTRSSLISSAGNPSVDIERTDMGDVEFEGSYENVSNVYEPGPADTDLNIPNKDVENIEQMHPRADLGILTPGRCSDPLDIVAPEIDGDTGQTGPPTDGTDETRLGIGAEVKESEVKARDGVDLASTTTLWCPGPGSDSAPRSKPPVSTSSSCDAAPIKYATLPVDTDDDTPSIGVDVPAGDYLSVDSIAHGKSSAMSMSDSSETGSMEYTMSDIEEVDLMDEHIEFVIPDVIVSAVDAVDDGDDEDGKPPDSISDGDIDMDEYVVLTDADIRAFEAVDTHGDTMEDTGIDRVCNTREPCEEIQSENVFIGNKYVSDADIPGDTGSVCEPGSAVTTQAEAVGHDTVLSVTTTDLDGTKDPGTDLDNRELNEYKGLDTNEIISEQNDSLEITPSEGLHVSTTSESDVNINTNDIITSNEPGTFAPPGMAPEVKCDLPAEAVSDMRTMGSLLADADQRRTDDVAIRDDSYDGVELIDLQECVDAQSTDHQANAGEYDANNQERIGDKIDQKCIDVDEHHTCSAIEATDSNNITDIETGAHQKHTDDYMTGIDTDETERHERLGVEIDVPSNCIDGGTTYDQQHTSEGLTDVSMNSESNISQSNIHYAEFSADSSIPEEDVDDCDLFSAEDPGEFFSEHTALVSSEAMGMANVGGVLVLCDILDSDSSDSSHAYTLCEPVGSWFIVPDERSDLSHDDSDTEEESEERGPHEPVIGEYKELHPIIKQTFGSVDDVSDDAEDGAVVMRRRTGSVSPKKRVSFAEPIDSDESDTDTVSCSEDLLVNEGAAGSVEEFNVLLTGENVNGEQQVMVQEDVVTHVGDVGDMCDVDLCDEETGETGIHQEQVSVDDMTASTDSEIPELLSWDQEIAVEQDVSHVADTTEEMSKGNCDALVEENASAVNIVAKDDGIILETHPGLKNQSYLQDQILDDLHESSIDPSECEKTATNQDIIAPDTGEEQPGSDVKVEEPSGSDIKVEEPSMSDIEVDEQPGSDVKVEEHSGNDSKVEQHSGSDVKVEEQSGSDTKLEEKSGSDVKVEELSFSDVNVAEQSESDVKVEEQSGSDVKLEEQLVNDVKVEEQSASDVNVEEQPEDDVKVEVQPDDDVKVEEQPDDDIKVEEQPEGDAKVEEQPEGDVKVEEQPESDVKVVEQPKDDVNVEVQPEDDVKVEVQPDDDVKVEEQPDDDIKVEEQPEGDAKVEEQPEGDVKVEEQPEGDAKVEEQPEDDVKVEVQPEDDVKAEQQTQDDVKVEVQPDDDVKVEKQPEDDVKVEEQPDDDIKVEEQPEGDAKVEEQPEDDVKVEVQPEDDVKAEQQPQDDIKVKEQPEDDVKVEEQPEDDVKVEVQPDDDVKVEKQPEDDVKVEEQPGSDVKVEVQPEDDVKAEQQPQDDIKVEEQSEDNVKVEEQPEDDVKVEEQPEDDVNVEVQPEDDVNVEKPLMSDIEVEEQPGSDVKVEEHSENDVKVEEHSRSDVKVDEKSMSDVKVEELSFSDINVEDQSESDIKLKEQLVSDVNVDEQSGSDVKVEGQPEDDIKVEEQPEDDVKMEEQPEDDVKVEVQPEDDVKVVEQPEANSRMDETHILSKLSSSGHCEVEQAIPTSSNQADNQMERTSNTTDGNGSDSITLQDESVGDHSETPDQTSDTYIQPQRETESVMTIEEFGSPLFVYGTQPLSIVTGSDYEDDFEQNWSDDPPDHDDAQTNPSGLPTEPLVGDSDDSSVILPDSIAEGEGVSDDHRMAECVTDDMQGVSVHFYGSIKDKGEVVEADQGDKGTADQFIGESENLHISEEKYDVANQSDGNERRTSLINQTENSHNPQEHMDHEAEHTVVEEQQSQKDRSDDNASGLSESVVSCEMESRGHLPQFHDGDEVTSTLEPPEGEPNLAKRPPLTIAIRSDSKEYHTDKDIDDMTRGAVEQSAFPLSPISPRDLAGLRPGSPMLQPLSIRCDPVDRHRSRLDVGPPSPLSPSWASDDIETAMFLMAEDIEKHKRRRKRSGSKLQEKTEALVEAGSKDQANPHGLRSASSPARTSHGDHSSETSQGTKATLPVAKKPDMSAVKHFWPQSQQARPQTQHPVTDRHSDVKMHDVQSTHTASKNDSDAHTAAVALPGCQMSDSDKRSLSTQNQNYGARPKQPKETKDTVVKSTDPDGVIYGEVTKEDRKAARKKGMKFVPETELWIDCEGNPQQIIKGYKEVPIEKNPKGYKEVPIEKKTKDNKPGKRKDSGDKAADRLKESSDFSHRKESSESRSAQPEGSAYTVDKSVVREVDIDTILGLGVDDKKEKRKKHRRHKIDPDDVKAGLVLMESRQPKKKQSNVEVIHDNVTDEKPVQHHTSAVHDERTKKKKKITQAPETEFSPEGEKCELSSARDSKSKKHRKKQLGEHEASDNNTDPERQNPMEIGKASKTKKSRKDRRDPEKPMPCDNDTSSITETKFQVIEKDIPADESDKTAHVKDHEEDRKETTTHDKEFEWKETGGFPPEMHGDGSVASEEDPLLGMIVPFSDYDESVDSNYSESLSPSGGIAVTEGVGDDAGRIAASSPEPGHVVVDPTEESRDTPGRDLREQDTGEVLPGPSLLGHSDKFVGESAVAEAMEKLKGGADEAPIRSTAAQLTSSHNDLRDPTSGPGLELLPVRHYDWNSLHFYPDIHEVNDVQLRGPHANILRQRAHPNWDRTKQEMMDMVRQNEADMKSMQSKPPVYSSSDEENVPPRGLYIPGDQWMYQPRPPVSTDSGSGTEGDSVKSSPKVWKKNPMRSRHVARDERRASWAGPGTESPSPSMYSRKRVGGSPTSLRERTPSPRRQRRALNVAISPRRERARDVKRHNSDIQEKYAKFEELQSRRRALESSSEEDIPNRNIRTTTVLQKRQSPQPVKQTYSTSVQKTVVQQQMKSSFKKSSQYTETKDIKRLNNVRGREQSDPSLISVKPNMEISEPGNEEEVREIGKDVFKQRLAQFEQMQQLKFSPQFRSEEKAEMHEKSQSYLRKKPAPKSAHGSHNKHTNRHNVTYREPNSYTSPPRQENSDFISQNVSNIPNQYHMVGRPSPSREYYRTPSPGRPGQAQELYNQILQQPCERVSNLQEFYKSQQRLSRAFENKEIFDEAMHNAFSDQQGYPTKWSPPKWLKQRQNLESQSVDLRPDPRQESRNSNRLSDDRDMDSGYYSHERRKGTQAWRRDMEAITDESSRRLYDTDLHTTPDSETCHLDRTQELKTMSSSFENIYDDVNLAPCSPSMNYPNGGRRFSYDMLDERGSREPPIGYPIRPVSAAELQQQTNNDLFQEQRPHEQHHARHNLHDKYNAKAIVAEEQQKYEQYRAEYERNHPQSGLTEQMPDSWGKDKQDFIRSPKSVERDQVSHISLHANPQDPPERDFSWPPFSQRDHASISCQQPHYGRTSSAERPQIKKDSMQPNVQQSARSEHILPIGHEDAYQMRIFHMRQNAISGDPLKPDDKTSKTQPAIHDVDKGRRPRSKRQHASDNKDARVLSQSSPSSRDAVAVNRGIFRTRSCHVPDSWDIAHAVPDEGPRELEDCMYRGSRKRSLTAGPELQRPTNSVSDSLFHTGMDPISRPYDRREEHVAAVEDAEIAGQLERGPRDLPMMLRHGRPIEKRQKKQSLKNKPGNNFDSPKGSVAPVYADPLLTRRRLPSGESSHNPDSPHNERASYPEPRQRYPSGESSHIPDSPSHPHPEAWDLERSVPSPVPFEIRDHKQLNKRYDSDLNRSILKKGAEIIRKPTKAAVNPEYYHNTYNKYAHQPPVNLIPNLEDHNLAYLSEKPSRHTDHNMSKSLPCDNSVYIANPRYGPMFPIPDKKKDWQHTGYTHPPSGPSQYEHPVHDYENIPTHQSKKSAPSQDVIYAQPQQAKTSPPKPPRLSSQTPGDFPICDYDNRYSHQPASEKMFYIQGLPVETKHKKQDPSRVCIPSTDHQQHPRSLESPYVDVAQIKHMKAKRLATKEHPLKNMDPLQKDTAVIGQKQGSQSVMLSISGVKKTPSIGYPNKSTDYQAASPERPSRPITPNTLEIKVTAQANNEEKPGKGKWPLFRSRSHGDMRDRPETSKTYMGGIKAKLLSKHASVAEKEAVLQELSKILEGRKHRLHDFRAEMYSSQDEFIPTVTSPNTENVIDNYAMRKGCRKPRPHVEDDLTELERVFANLGINEDEIQRPEIGRIRQLSVPNLRQLERQHSHEEAPNVEYLHHWLAEGSVVDRLPPSDVSRPQSEASEFTMSEFRSISALSDDSPLDKVYPHKITDDMALRRYRDSVGPPVRTPSRPIVAYQYKSPGITPATSLENLSRRSSGRSKTPDPVVDDMAVRQQSRNISLDESSSSLPLPSPTTTDYLVPRVTSPARGRMRIRPDVEADRYHDDMAYRRLRRDVPPVKAEFPESYQRARQGLLGSMIRSRSLEGPRNALPADNITRERSSSISGPPSNKINMAKGVAQMVHFFDSPIQHAQSAPNLYTKPSVFSANYDGEGNLIKINLCHQPASPTKPKTTPRIVKQRHERRMKIRGLSHPIESPQQGVEGSVGPTINQPFNKSTKVATATISTPTYHLCPETTKVPWHSESKLSGLESRASLPTSPTGVNKSPTIVPLRVGPTKLDRPRPRSLEISSLRSAFFAPMNKEPTKSESKEYISQSACNTPESPSSSPTKIGTISPVAPSTDAKYESINISSPIRVTRQVSPVASSVFQETSQTYNFNCNNNNNTINDHYDCMKKRSGTNETQKYVKSSQESSQEFSSERFQTEKAVVPLKPHDPPTKRLNLKEAKPVKKAAMKKQTIPISHIQKPSVPTEPINPKKDFNSADLDSKKGQKPVPINVAHEGKQDLVFEHLLSKHPSMQRPQKPTQDPQRLKKSLDTTKKSTESSDRETVYKEVCSKESRSELRSYHQSSSRREMGDGITEASQPRGDVYNEGFEVGDMLKEIVKSHGNALSFLDALERPTSNQGPESLTRNEPIPGNQRVSSTTQHSARNVSETPAGRKITSSVQQECRVVAQQRTYVETIPGRSGEVLLGPSSLPSPSALLSPMGFDTLDMLVASQPLMSADELDMSDYENNMPESDVDDRQTDILVERELTSRKKIQSSSTRSYRICVGQTETKPQAEPSSESSGFIDIPVMHRKKAADDTKSSAGEKRERRRSIKELVDSFESQIDPYLKVSAMRKATSHESLPGDVDSNKSFRDVSGSVPDVNM